MMLKEKIKGVGRKAILKALSKKIYQVVMSGVYADELDEANDA